MLAGLRMRQHARIPTQIWLRTFGGETPLTSHDHAVIILNLWTWVDTPTCGLMPFSSAALAGRLELQVDRVDAVISDLEAADFVTVQDGLIWLHGYIEMQLGGVPTKSEKWLNSTLKALDALPDCSIVARYRAHYRLPDGTDVASVAAGKEGQR